MNISLPSLLVAIGLYGLCVAVTVRLVLHLRDRVLVERAMGLRWFFVAFRDVVVLLALPIIASIAAFFLPSFVLGFFGGAAPRSPADIGAFAVTQLIWSAPSACFYALSTRLRRERFSLRRIVGWTIASLVVLGVLAPAGRSALPQFAAGVIAQVVGGMLPLSVISAAPLTIAIAVDGSATRIDWHSISIARAAWLCTGIVLGYRVLKSRTAAVDEFS